MGSICSNCYAKKGFSMFRKWGHKTTLRVGILHRVTPPVSSLKTSLYCGLASYTVQHYSTVQQVSTAGDHQDHNRITIPSLICQVPQPGSCLINPRQDLSPVTTAQLYAACKVVSGKASWAPLTRISTLHSRPALSCPGLLMVLRWMFRTPWEPSLFLEAEAWLMS